MGGVSGTRPSWFPPACGQDTQCQPWPLASWPWSLLRLGGCLQRAQRSGRVYLSIVSDRLAVFGSKVEGCPGCSVGSLRVPRFWRRREAHGGGGAGGGGRALFAQPGASQTWARGCQPGRIPRAWPSAGDSPSRRLSPPLQMQLKSSPLLGAWEARRRPVPQQIFTEHLSHTSLLTSSRGDVVDEQERMDGDQWRGGEGGPP